ncbi:MAG: type II toxin-antitoxin system ParD family antitoxin [bacterium]|nr:type II toxin-antitoxin system ParD family antitoxin [bacterium]
MAGRTTLNVSLTPKLSDFVAATVASGRYLSASEVVREGLRLLEEREVMRQTGLEEARQKIAAGLASLDRGEGIPGEQVFAEIESRLARLEQEKTDRG